MKISDYLTDFFVNKDVDLCFAITGAGNIRIIESLSKNINIICPHHEQAAVMAAITYWRSSNKLPIVTVTGGPGAINSLTGVADAYLDSIPLIVLAGQEKSDYVIDHENLRAMGVQGLKMWEIVKSITKYSVIIKNKDNFIEELNKAYHEATNGRPGPVWIEIPQDVQWQDVDCFTYNKLSDSESLKPNIDDIKIILDKISSSKRPLIVAGHGIRLSNSVNEFLSLINKMNIPVISTWQAADIVKDDNNLFVGRAGQYGQRFANFAIQSCDLLISFGSRLALPQRGFDDTKFAPNADKIIIDLDKNELNKFKFDKIYKINFDVKDIIELLSSQEYNKKFTKWLHLCHDWKRRYKMYGDAENGKSVNSYWFINELSKYLNDDDIIVTDMGTSLTCTHAAIVLRKNQRLITSTGLGEMGFGLPGAIGAALGSNKRVVLICGEGSFMMNLQELQTLVNLKLPIIIIMLNNDGYLTIKHTHNALYNSVGNSTATHPESGVSFPNFKKVIKSFDIKYKYLSNSTECIKFLKKLNKINESYFCEIKMDSFQELIPKLAIVKNKNGEITTPSLENLYPYLPEETLSYEMNLAKEIE